MTAPLNLAALKALHEAATKGKWTMIPTPHKRILKTGPTVVLGMTEADADFAVAAHTHWLELLAMAGASDTKDWGDKPLPEDAVIDAAHPLRSERHDMFQEALRLVGARRSKYGLVELVNWLLLEAATREADWQHEMWAADKAEAGKAAMAERLAIAEVAVARHVTQRCRCRGKGSYSPTCFRCDDSGDDHECPDDRQCVEVECAKAREVIAAHEAERGRE